MESLNSKLALFGRTRTNTVLFPLSKVSARAVTLMKVSIDLLLLELFNKKLKILRISSRNLIFEEEKKYVLLGF